MAKKQDDLTRLKANQTSVRFNDLERILKQHGWKLQDISGSHHIYSKAGRLPVMIVKPHGKHKYCHPIDVDKVIVELDFSEEAKEAEDEQNDESR